MERSGTNMKLKEEHPKAQTQGHTLRNGRPEAKQGQEDQRAASILGTTILKGHWLDRPARAMNMTIKVYLLLMQQGPQRCFIVEEEAQLGKLEE